MPAVRIFGPSLSPPTPSPNHRSPLLPDKVHALKASTNARSRSKVHVPSGGGGVADGDGEPEAAVVGEVLAATAPPGHAIVVWRCYGGAEVAPERLRQAYHDAAVAGIAIHAAKSPSKSPRRLCCQRCGGRGRVQGAVAASTGGGSGGRLSGMVLPLPVPCVYYDQGFLSTGDAAWLPDCVAQYTAAMALNRFVLQAGLF